MNKKLIWGIMGGGFIASQFTAGINEIEEGKIGAVASKSGNGRHITAPQYYNNYEDLALDKSIDIIYIGTIHPEHYKNIELCLKMGKPVLCEKPLVMNSQELQDIIGLSNKKEVFLMEAMWTRFLPLCTYLKEEISGGKLGKIQFIQISFGEVAAPEKERLHKASLGGGALMDIGVYGVNFAQWLLGENPDNIEGWSRKNNENIDLTTFIQMHYPSGADVELTVSIEKKLPNTALIMTDKGEYSVPYFWRPDTLICCETNNNFKVNRLKELKTCPIQGNGYQYEAIAAEQAIKNGQIESPVMSHKDSLDIMKTLDTIREKCGIIYS